MDDDTGICQVADHGHVTLFALVGEVRSFILGGDLAGVCILGMTRQPALRNPGHPGLNLLIAN